VRISGSNAGYTMFRGSVKGTGYPLHLPVSPSLPLPCITMCHHISTGVYNKLRASVKHWLCWQNSWVHISSVSKMCLLHESPCYTFNQNAHLHSNRLKWDIFILLRSYCRDFPTLNSCDYKNNFFFMISNWTAFSCAHKIYTTCQECKILLFSVSEYLWMACMHIVREP